MLLESIAANSAVKAIPWKWILTGLVAMVLVAGAWFTVHAYNSAISEANTAKESLKAAQIELRQTRDKLAGLQQELADLKTYYAAREKRQAQAADRRSQILSRKEKTDENGAIAADDPTLLDLNGLFPNADSNNKADAANAADLSATSAGKIRPGG